MCDKIQIAIRDCLDILAGVLLIASPTNKDLVEGLSYLFARSQIAKKLSRNWSIWIRARLFKIFLLPVAWEL